jgi:hypothetical protein
MPFSSGPFRGTLDRTDGVLLGMTVVEAVAVSVWFFALRSDPARFLFTSLLVVGPILLLGLFVENALAFRQFGDRKSIAQLAGGLALTEAVIWSLWVTLLESSLYSPRGIGPALVVATVLFVLQHAVEVGVVSEGAHGPFTAGVITSSVVEATAATTLWVFTVEGRPLLAVVSLTVLLGLEHATRLSAGTTMVSVSDGLRGAVAGTRWRRFLRDGVAVGVTALALGQWMVVSADTSTVYLVEWLLAGATPLAAGLWISGWLLRIDDGPMPSHWEIGALAIVGVITLTQWQISISQTLYGATGPLAAGGLLAVLLTIYFAFEGHSIDGGPGLHPAYAVAGVGLAAGMTIFWTRGLGGAPVPGWLALLAGTAIATGAKRVAAAGAFTAPRSAPSR